MHPDTEQLQRMAHGEPVPAETRAHVSRCDECSARAAQLDEEEGRVIALLEQIVHASPPIGADAIRRRARADSPAWRRAAVVLLAVGLAGAAYAAPGSPLPGLVERAVGWAAGRPAPRPGAAAADDPRPSSRGILVVPEGDFIIDIRTAGAGAVAAVRIIGNRAIAVRSPAEGVGFTSDANRLVVDVRSDSARLEIGIPEGAAVTVRADGRAVLVSDGKRILTPIARDSSGIYVIALDAVPR